MRRSGVDLCDVYTNGAQKGRDFVELDAAYYLYVFQCFIDGVDCAVRVGGMSADAFCGAVQNHQPAFCNSHLHACRLADYCIVDGADFREQLFQSAGAGNFFLRGSGKYKPVGGLLLRKCLEGLQKGDQRAAIVIGTKTEELVAFQYGFEGVKRPAAAGFNCIYVGVQKHCAAAAAAFAPDVVAFAVRVQALAPQAAVQIVSRCSLFPAEGRDRYQFFQQLGCHAFSSG